MCPAGFDLTGIASGCCTLTHTITISYLIVSPLVALHDELVSSGDEHQAVGVVELLRDVLTKMKMKAMHDKMAPTR